VDEAFRELARLGEDAYIPEGHGVV
jgi:hypothetical protein